jgi:O-antigen ligase/tetratricopeptide (TPR) repeat protein
LLSVSTLLLYIKILIKKQTQITVRLLDLILLIIVLSEIVNCYYSSYRPNSYSNFLKLLTLAWVYLSFNLFTEKRFEKTLKPLIALYGVLLSVATFVFFLVFRFTIYGEGFTDLLNFKHLYSPLGYISNDWSSVLIAFLAFFCYYALLRSRYSTKNNWWRIFGLSFILFGVLVSFSRGAYLSLFTFFVSAAIFLVLFKVIDFISVIKYIAFLAFLIFSLTYLLGEPVIRTAKGLETTSQKRSAIGRLTVWERAEAMFQTNPLHGIGSGNFALQYVSNKPNSIDSEYTTRVNNTPIQILVEKGIVGFILYGGLYFYLVVLLVLNIKSSPTEKGLFGCFILALVVATTIKELTFSSLFEHYGLLLLFTTILLFFRHQSKVIFNVEGSFGLVIFLAFLAFVCAYFFYKNTHSTKMLTSAIRAASENNFESSLVFLNSAIDDQPNQAVLYVQRGINTYERQKNHKSELSESDSLFYIKDFDIDDKNLKAMISDYSIAIHLNPLDERANYNLGWCFFLLGDKNNAEKYLKKSLLLDQGEVLYSISLALLYENSNDTLKANNYYKSSILTSPDLLQSIFWKEFTKRYANRSRSIQLDARRKFESLDTTNAVIKAKYASFLLALLEYKKASRLLESVVAEMPNLSRAWFNLGILYFENGLFDRGIECVKRAILLDINDYAPVLFLASYLERSEKYDEAISFYRRALEMVINSKSNYDLRMGKVYGVAGSQLTVFPSDLWYKVKFTYSSNDICYKLSRITRKVGLIDASNAYYKLSKMKHINSKDILLD